MKKFIVRYLFASLIIFQSPLQSSNLLNNLTLREKIGQLLMVGAYSYNDEYGAATIETLIKDHAVGNLIFMSGVWEKQVELAARYQKCSKHPLLIAQDAEWGTTMRLSSLEKKLVVYPHNLTLGALSDVNLIEETGFQIGKDLQACGVHMNFAPVIDVNSNPANPVIGNRSFGDNPFEVAARGNAFIKGLQRSGILACVKHALGHGDTVVDSHLGLPVINKTLEELEKMELIPFRAAFKKGVGACMMAHICMPQIDSTPGLPSSLSKKIVSSIVREKLGFKGLIVTDSLNMQAVTNAFPLPEAALLALKAGNDILLFCKSAYESNELLRDITSVIDRIEKAVREREITEAELDKHVQRILKTKETVVQKDMQDVVHGQEAQEQFVYKLYENAVTLFDKGHQLPLSSEDRAAAAFVQIGGEHTPAFYKELSEHINLDAYYLMSVPSEDLVERLLIKLPQYKTVIVGVYKMNNRAAIRWGISTGALSFIKRLQKIGNKVVVVLFGSPYALTLLDHKDAFVVAYEENFAAEQVAARIVGGTLISQGTLPITV